MRNVWVLPSARETEQLGAALARGCPVGSLDARLLFLSGELGAGKTTLAAALLQALGVQEAVRSPSYALIETYTLPALQAVHIDLYRLQGAQELEQLGVRDYLNPQTLLLIEWPERAARALPVPDLAVQLELAAQGPLHGRRCRIEARSPAGEAWLALTGQLLPPMPDLTCQI
jgi:tRNA threonylcarbamoyl adenosine modification protein YjeE